MKTSTSMDISILEDLGLTNAEIKIYLALLELGSTSVGAIIDKSCLQSSVVHMTLHNLVEKGFVSFVKEGKRKHYQASNPNNIVEYINEKKERFQKILPMLIAKQTLTKEKQDITVFRGIRGIRELLTELLEAGGKEHNTFGSTENSLIMGEAWWVSYHKKRAAKGIYAKLLFNESLRSWKAEKKYPKTKVKYTKFGFEPLTETIIRNNRVGIIIWTDKPLGILIEHKEVADSYNKFFEVLWKTTG